MANNIHLVQPKISKTFKGTLFFSIFFLIPLFGFPTDVLSQKLYEKACSFYYENQSDSAIFYFEEALNLLNTNDNSKLHFQCKINIALCYIKNGNSTYGIFLLEEILQHSYLKEHPIEMAKVLEDLAIEYIAYGEFYKAGKILLEAETIFKLYEPEANLGALYQNLSAVFLYTCQYTEAKRYSDLYLSESIKISDTVEIVNAKINKSLIYKQIGDIEKSSELLNEAIFLAYKIAYIEGIIKAESLSAQLFAYLQNHEMTLFKLKISDSLSNFIYNPQLKAEIKSNIGITYKLMNRYDLALQYLQEALLLNYENIKTKASVYLNISDIYRLLNENDKAQYYLLQALEIVEKTNLHTLQIDIYYQLTEIMFQQNDRMAAIEYGEKVIQNAKLINDFNSLCAMYGLLARIYETGNDFEKANQYLKLKIDAESERITNNFVLQMASIQNANEILNLEKQTILLNKENTTKTQTITFQKKVLIGLFIFSIVSFVLLVLLLVNFRSNLLNRKFLVRKAKEKFNINNQNNFQEQENVKSKTENSNLTEQNNKKFEETQKYKELLLNLQNLVNYEKIYLNQTINLGDIALRLNTNRTYLSNAINSVLNINFNRYINKLRVQEACKLLSDENCNLTIEGISQSVGFSSKSSFNTAFKSITGVTPSFFREEALDAVQQNKK